MRITTGVFRSAIAMIVAIFSMVAMAFPAFAQYPPEGDTGEASGPTTVEPGSEPTFQASGFAAESDVFVVLSGVLSGTATVTANAQGVAAFTVTVPCDTAAGEAQIDFSGSGDDGGANTAGMTFTITEESAACPTAGDDDAAGAPDADEEEPTGLAATGGEITTGLTIATVVLLAGAGLVVTSRNRRREHADH